MLATLLATLAVVISLMAWNRAGQTQQAAPAPGTTVLMTDSIGRPALAPLPAPSPIHRPHSFVWEPAHEN